MNLSTSSSEPGRWKAFTATLLAVAAVCLTLVLGVAYLADPYDTGRSMVLAKPGLRPQGPRTAAASRGRDQAYNAMITGNSHIQLLSPERLKALTGLDFVQLSVPASGPKEQFTLVDWFMRHRESPAKALVLSADSMWCTPNPDMPNDKPFPFWLFARSTLQYVRGLLRYDILEEAPRRVLYLLDPKAERARPDGYWDYEPDYIALGYDRDPVLRRRLDETPPAPGRVAGNNPPEGEYRFPVADVLRERAAGLPQDLALIVVFPPNYKNLLPPPGSEAARRDDACKQAIRSALKVHARSAVIDWRVDRPENRDPRLFFDMTHYRHAIARAIERDIAQALEVELSLWQW